MFHVFRFFELKTKQGYYTYLVFSLLRTEIDEVYCADGRGKVLLIFTASSLILSFDESDMLNHCLIVAHLAGKSKT